MEVGKPLDLTALDWDDSQLIRAYDIINKKKNKKNTASESKNKKNSSNKAIRNEKRWMLGDYCRAPFPDDGLMYEARIISIYDDDCTVEYLGFEGEEEVPLSQLAESHGKNARKKQKKKAEGGYISSDTERTSMSEIEALREEVEHLRSKLDQQPPQPTTDFYQSSRPQPPNLQQPHYYPNNANLGAVQRVEDVLPLPAPPMPQNTTVSRDPTLQAMLISWYMAGYHTGMHQARNQRSSHCPIAPRQCCDYPDMSNNCCHH